MDYFSEDIITEVKAFLDGQTKFEMTHYYCNLLEEIIRCNFTLNRICYTEDVQTLDRFKGHSKEFIVEYVDKSHFCEIVTIITIPQLDGTKKIGFQLHNFKKLLL